MHFKISFFSLFCLVLLTNCYAQPGERGVKVKQDSSGLKGNTYAIIIGISKYKNVSALQYADKDAQAFEDFLVSNAGGNIPRTNIETFLNEKASKDYVADAISVLARKAKPGDRAYFFFAGHGDMEDLTQIENGLLLLYNSPDGNYFGMKDDVLEIMDLKRYVSPLAQRGVEIIFIVDACHSGNLKGGVEGSQQTAAALASSWGKEYKILSCQPNQLSLESGEWGGGRGLFSFQLEEGMKGMADMDNNGVVSMFELQSYIQTNVAKYSEGKQIPLITGDLSKPIAKVDPAILAALKKQKEENYPILAKTNPKGNEEKYIDSMDATGKKIYFSFKKNLDEKKLILPADTNALRDYKAFVKKYADNPLTPIMRRNLAAALNDRFDSIVSPLLKGGTSYSTREECKFAAAELDSCLHLLGEQHYLYTNLKARKLFMEAMALTWALTESEYNISLRPAVEKSVRLLEESEALEPNAAYTISALGTRYFYIYEYDKAFAKFQKYLDLRPNDFYSKYSLGLLFMKLKQYEKGQVLFEKLIKENPAMVELFRLLAETYFYQNRKKESLDCAMKIVEIDKAEGYFYLGVYYYKTNKVDSAVYYYKLSKMIYKQQQQSWDCPMCDNNIGAVYLADMQLDSARRYFNLLVKADSTDPFPNFNLGTIEAMNGNYFEAINRFIYAIDYSTSFQEAVVSHLEMYFNKRYIVKDTGQYKEFKERVFYFDIQYAGYLSILYCYLRDARLSGQTDKFELIFSRLFNYKEYDVLTWYHHACYRSLNNDKKAALESLEKSLKLGFGNYFLLTSDADLEYVRNTPEFKALLQQYFPQGR